MSARATRALLLGIVLLVAACGFVYELVIVALGTYLFGNSVEQVSLVLAAFVSSMGLGSLLAKPLLRAPLRWFAAVEAAIALIGGLSAMVLYAAFAWADLYQPAMLLTAGAIGLLVGCEIPLLLTLMQRVRREDAGTSVADLLAADYLGAVVAGVSFPFLLLPLLGQIQAALAIGALNAIAGLVVLAALRGRARLGVPLMAVLAVLGGAAVASARFEVSARQALYDDPIALEVRTPYQDVVVTRSLDGRDTRLFLNGDLQFSSVDERRYHEALVHPAMAGRHASVLILGGGDGLALREVLRHPGVERAVLVDLDPAVVRVARERLAALNARAFEDPRVAVVHADGFGWVRAAAPREGFDVVIADYPDPDDAGTAKLYAVEHYAGVARLLAPGGRFAVQAGSPAFARESFWSVAASLRAAGFATTAYHVDVPSFGEWGFHLAQRAAVEPVLALPAGVPLTTLDAASLRAAAVFTPDRRAPAGIEASTLNRPRILEYQRRGYRGY